MNQTSQVTPTTELITARFTLRQISLLRRGLVVLGNRLDNDPHSQGGLGRHWPTKSELNRLDQLLNQTTL